MKPTGDGVRSLVILLLLGALAAGCGDDPPPTLGGAGLRLHLPPGADTLAWVQVEIWHDNPVPPVLCSLLTTDASPTAPLSGPQACLRRSAEVRNLLGETVRRVEETPFPDRTWAWDQRDEEGNLVPGGIYPTWQFCEEGQGADFSGHYYTGPRGEGPAGEWILWSRRLEGPVAATLEFAPFPEHFWILWWVDDESGGCAEVTPQFQSPFELRVRAPGMTTHHESIDLVEETFTEVTVSLPPLAGGVP